MTRPSNTIRRFLFSLVVLFVTIFVGEILLKIFFPFTFATIGHVYSKNAKLYGWGFNPHQIINIRDPDTGEVYTQPVNNHGWRDRNRSYSNNREAYRILVLGDSITFGANVPMEKIYTQVLEDRLSKNGFNAEVINIAYGGWGTGQQLEALRNEGLKYKPNLVIFQFHVNDLRENIFFTASETNKDSRRELIPFYYFLDDDNHLVRHKNPYYGKKWQLKDKIKIKILKSEIGKRLYSLYFAYRWRETPIKEKSFKEGRLQDVTYYISKNQIEQLELTINLRNKGKLSEYLYMNIDKEVKVNELCDIIKVSDHIKDMDTILRILEKRSFHQNWSRENYYPREQDINSYPWRLYFALINLANNLVTKEDAQLALFCPIGVENYEWNVTWFRFSDDEKSKRNFLQYYQIIHDYASINKIGFIKKTRPYQMFRNDPHQNIKGHEAMAEDIYAYLMENHKAELSISRLNS